MPRRCSGGSLPIFLTSLLATAVFIGCSSGKETTSGSMGGVTEPSDSTASTISTEEAVALIAALEQEPLSSEASARRTILTAWVFASPDVGPMTIDDAPIRPFQESEHPYSPELFLQYMFGIARAQAVEHPAPQEAIESGLRSLLAAYKSIVVVDEKMRDPFLDELDRVRQQGKLGEYVRSVDKGK